VSMLCRDGGVEPSEINAVAIASVSPRIGMVYGEMAKNYLNCDPFFIHGEVPGFLNKYRNPRAVGADRVCDSVAGFEKYGGPLLIIDFGTAATIDVIDEEGAYLGGVILPGPETSVEALHQAAAMLPKVHLTMPDIVIGRTTEQSIRVGLMRGTVEGLRGLISEIRKELENPEAKVIATGGLAPQIVKYLPEVSAVEPDLVLEGIRLIYERSFKA